MVERRTTCVHIVEVLRRRGLISGDLVDKVMCWRHSGFDAYFGPPIPSLAEAVTVGLSVMRQPVAASRLVLEQGPVVRYFAKGIVPGKDTLGLFERESRTFDYPEWMARVTSHIPDRGAHLVHYLGAYSNKHRACEMAGGTESPCTSLDRSEPISTSDRREARRRSWARVIQRLWETNPLLCEKCGGQMKIIAFIDAKDQAQVVAAILDHIKWRFEVLSLPARPPPLPLSEEPGRRRLRILPLPYLINLAAPRRADSVYAPGAALLPARTIFALTAIWTPDTILAMETRWPPDRRALRRGKGQSGPSLSPSDSLISASVDENHSPLDQKKHS
ncbi:MAG: hypothetical protein HYX75_10460 [Acidobacteria bacterium]|nr:hypothetical protein [Acidobacteriota bacterium]